MQNSKIMILDDDMSVTQCMQMALELEGHQVITAENGLSALIKLGDLPKDQLPDCILVDIYMPVMNGHEFIERILNTPSLAHIPLILSSGTPKYKCGNINPKVRGYLQKPMNIWDLYDTIGSVLIAV